MNGSHRYEEIWISCLLYSLPLYLYYYIRYIQNITDSFIMSCILALCIFFIFSRNREIRLLFTGLSDFIYVNVRCVQDITARNRKYFRQYSILAIDDIIISSSFDTDIIHLLSLLDPKTISFFCFDIT